MSRKVSWTCRPAMVMWQFTLGRRFGRGWCGHGLCDRLNLAGNVLVELPRLEVLTALAVLPGLAVARAVDTIGFQIVIEQFWLLRNYAISHKHL